MLKIVENKLGISRWTSSFSSNIKWHVWQPLLNALYRQTGEFVLQNRRQCWQWRLYWTGKDTNLMRHFSASFFIFSWHFSCSAFVSVFHFEWIPISYVTLTQAKLCESTGWVSNHGLSDHWHQGDSFIDFAQKYLWLNKKKIFFLWRLDMKRQAEG